MTVVSRENVKPASLPTETHPCPSLGGDVIVRGALASSRLALETASRDGPLTVEQMLPKMLALSVVDEAGAPLLTEQEWNEHAGQHYLECVQLFNVAMRLWGFDGEANRKNS